MGWCLPDVSVVERLVLMLLELDLDLFTRQHMLRRTGKSTARGESNGENTRHDRMGLDRMGLAEPIGETGGEADLLCGLLQLW